MFHRVDDVNVRHLFWNILTNRFLKYFVPMTFCWTLITTDSLNKWFTEKLHEHWTHGHSLSSTSAASVRRRTCAIAVQEDQRWRLCINMRTLSEIRSQTTNYSSYIIYITIYWIFIYHILFNASNKDHIIRPCSLFTTTLTTTQLATITPPITWASRCRVWLPRCSWLTPSREPLWRTSGACLCDIVVILIASIIVVVINIITTIHFPPHTTTLKHSCTGRTSGSRRTCPHTSSPLALTLTPPSSTPRSSRKCVRFVRKLAFSMLWITSVTLSPRFNDRNVDSFTTARIAPHSRFQIMRPTTLWRMCLAILPIYFFFDNIFIFVLYINALFFICFICIKCVYFQLLFLFFNCLMFTGSIIWRDLSTLICHAPHFTPPSPHPLHSPFWASIPFPMPHNWDVVGLSATGVFFNLKNQ